MTSKSLRAFEAAFPFTMTADGTFVYSYNSLFEFLGFNGTVVMEFVVENGLTIDEKGIY